MIGVELCTFTPADQAETRAVIQAGLRERWGDAFDPSANPDTDDLWASYVEPGGEIVVAVAGGRIVGTGTLIEPEPRLGQLVRVSTHPDHRRRGVARRIVAELIGRARARGHERLIVQADTPWRSAVALYASCGFDIVGQDALTTRLALGVAPDGEACET